MSPITVRYRDADLQGHLYFANYLVYADEAVCHYWRELEFSFEDADDLPCYTFTVNANIDWLDECRVNDLIEVSVRFSRLGNSSADTEYELLNTRTGALSAKGTFTHVFVDKSTRKSCPIPTDLRARILQRQPELAA
ncbi:putative thioesterase [Luminiphilus syltensis NOR5-1B]|uniref:Putative thioesterase n=2 Tax=Luminiphilus TaxID=1341118 RepID=B8KTQ7_9GAMM|nr:putative thioesterase [Luminiphilus syltensis NOR5-1B]